MSSGSGAAAGGGGGGGGQRCGGSAQDTGLSAWFEKKGAVNPSWRKRWFDLKENCIEYRKAPSDTVPRGVINLSDAKLESLPPEDNNWQDRLAIHTAAGRTYMIRAKLALLKEWIPAVQDRINAISSDISEPPLLRGSNSIGEMTKIPLDDARKLVVKLRPLAICDGFLEKKGEQRKNWKIRWFELRESRFDYFKHPADSTPKGSIMLRDCVVDVNNDTTDSTTTAKGLIFLEISPAQSSRTYRLRGSPEVIQEWELALRKCISSLKTRTSKYTPGPMIQDGVGLSQEERNKAQIPTATKRRPAGPLISNGQVIDLPEGDTVQIQVSDNTQRIKEREEAVIEMHTSMETINSMMTDMASLIKDQGHKLERIEMSADAMHASVEDGVDNLGIALKRT
eukprot:gene4260-6584_t